MIYFRFNNTTTIQLNCRLDQMKWWNVVPEFMCLCQFVRLGFPKDTMLFQVEHYIQMPTKLSICRGWWFTRHAFQLVSNLFYFTLFCYYSYCSIAWKYNLFIAYCIWMYCFQDSAIIVLNKPPKLPVKVWMSILQYL